MKAGVENRKKTVGAISLMALALLLAGRLFLPSETLTHHPTDATRTYSVQPNAAAGSITGNSFSLDPTLHYAQLELTENERYMGSGRNIFRSEREHVPKQTPPVRAQVPPSPIPQASESRIPLRFFGFVSMLDIPRKAFLGVGDAVFVAREGEVVDRRYRVVKIDANSVEVEDLIEHSKHTLSLPG